MKILHIGKYYPPFEGGIENFLASLLKCNSTKGVQNFVLAHHHQLWKKTSTEQYPEAKILRSPTIFRLLFAPIAPLFYFHLKSLLASFKPDLIHVHMPNLSAFWLLLAGRHQQCPIIVHWHADVVPSRRNPLLSIAYFFYRMLERKLLEKAAAIIVTSPPYLGSSKPLAKWQHKCHVIPLGLPCEGSSALENSPPSRQDTDRFKLLCIGRLTYYKGQHFLIEAVAQLPETELILVGTGTNLGKYKKLITRLQLQDRVKLFGHATSSELEALLGDCDCLCLPSVERTEAFGLVLLEAMQHARPCICTDVEGSGMSWVVQDGKTGLVVKSADVESLKLGIDSLSKNRIWSESLGSNGFERFSTAFDLDLVSNKILNLYNAQLNPDKHILIPPTNNDDI